MKPFSEFLDEAKQVGILYHFTKIDRLISLIEKSNFTVYSLNGEVFSLSRNPSLSHITGHPVINVRNGYLARINIDGNKLSERVKIRPILGLIDNSYGVFDLKNIRRVPRDWQEQEEVIPVGTNIKPYIKSVSILSYGTDEEKKLIEILKKHKIQASIEKTWKNLNEWEFHGEI